VTTEQAASTPLEGLPAWARPLVPDWVAGLRDRAVVLEGAEILSRAKGGTGRTVEAYAAVFGRAAEVRDQDGHYLEQVGQRAFERSIRERLNRINVFYSHGKTLYGTPSDRATVPIGTPKELRADGRGLLTVTEYNRTPLADEVLEAIKSGSMRGMSFTGAFLRSDKPGPFYPHGDGTLETVTRLEIALMEYGPTPLPTYDEAEVLGVRSATFPDPGEREQITIPLAPAPPEASSSTPESTGDGVHETTPQESQEGPAAQSTETEGQPPPESTTPQSTTPPQEPGPPSAPEGNGTPPTTPTPQEGTTVPGETQDQATMTVAERNTRLNEIRTRMQEIHTQHPGELPTDIETEWTALDAEETVHVRAIAAAEQRRERLAAFAADQQNGGPSGETVGQRAGYGSGQAPAFHRTADPHDLAAYRQRARSVDELPALYREGALQVAERARYGLNGFRGRVSMEDAQQRVRELLDQDDADGTLAHRILVTGSPTYERAFFKYLQSGSMVGLSAEEQRALSMGSATSAQLAVPFTLDPTVILTSDGSTNPLREISRVETITGRAWEGVTSAGITVGRAGEFAEVDDDAPSLAQPTVTPTRVDGFVPFSIEADQDWTRLRSEMTRLLQDAKDQEEAASFVTGTGTGNNPSGIAQTLATTSNVNDGFTSFGADDLYAVENALPPRFQPRARWLGRKNAYNLVRALDTSGGGSLWVRLGPGIPGELIGYPAHEASAMPTRTTAASRWLILGDFQQFLIVDRAGMDVELIPHLFSTGNNRPYGARGLVAYWRNNSKILVDNAFRGLTYAT
jgi:HK97 family phage major capsid protein/HK97 family phage prohead protease